MRRLMKILNVVFDVLLGAAFIVGAAVIVLRIMGYSLLAVETGSMGKAYPVGCLVITESCEPQDIEVGDVITFVAGEDLTTVTHRVIEVDAENGFYVTQGDANNAPDDAEVLFENLVGRVRFKIPKVGYAVMFAKTSAGKAAVAAVLSLAAIVIAVGELKKHSDKSKDKSRKE